MVSFKYVYVYIGATKVWFPVFPANCGVLLGSKVCILVALKIILKPLKITKVGLK